MTGKVAMAGLALLAFFIFGSFLIQLRREPSRTQTTRLDAFGEVSVHLETDPDPPKTGRIPLILHITDRSGRPVQIDRIRLDYALEDMQPRDVEGESAGIGTFRAVCELDQVGEWNVRVTLFSGNQQTQVAFTLRVGSNI